MLSVLPLEVWPFEPLQTALHYRAHLFYAVAQVPLLGILAWASGHDAATDSGV